MTLTLANLAAMPRQTVRVPTPPTDRWRRMKACLCYVLKKAGVPFGGEALASDGYQVVFTPGEIDPSFGSTAILIADHRGLVVPNDKEGARSVRMLESLEFVRLRK